MKKSVLKANKELANKACYDFLKLNDHPDWKNNGVEFRRKELTETEDGAPLEKGSFEVRYTKLIDGKRKGRAVFRFLKKKCGNEIEWDEKFITI